MKYLVIALSMTILTTAASAQSNKEDIAIIQNTYGKEKKEIVYEMLAIDSAGASPFWKLYDEFESERKALGRQRIALLEDYVNKYDALTPEQADKMVLASFKNNGDLDKVYEKYYKKAAKIIGPMSAAKWMQVEDYLRGVVKLTIQDQMPFVNDLKHK
jgi:hypothetical protein